MNDDTASATTLARLILKQEVATCGGPYAEVDGVAQAFGKLRACIANVIGELGFEAILARATHDTAAVFAWVAEDDADLTQGGEGSWLALASTTWGADAVRDGAIMLLGRVVGLLFRFIGETLTMRLVERVWADLPPRKNKS